MTVAGERILIVESDPDISSVIARQALQPLGFQVSVVSDVANAIQEVIRFSPDLIIANLNLPGLSGKDLLAALASRGINSPRILLAEKGQENSLIQAFRLGATDYLLWPARETEVIAVVERALKQVRDARARQRLDQQLKDTNQEMQRRVRELTTILALGKAVTSMTDQRILFENIIEGAMHVAEADYGWLLLRDERRKTFPLVAHRNLPEAWAKKINQPLDDGISSMVMVSGETLAIHGNPLRQFKVASLGQSVVAVPVKVQKEVIGLLVVVRKSAEAVTRDVQTLLEAVADYASISLVQARLFRALEQSAESAQAGEHRKSEMIQSLREEVQAQVQSAIYPVDLLLAEKMGPLTAEQQQALGTIQAALQLLSQTVNAKP